MPPSQIEMLEKLITAKFDGLEKYLDEKFNTNDTTHKEFGVHFKKLNGQTSKNTKARWVGTAFVALCIFSIPLILRYS